MTGPPEARPLGLGDLAAWCREAGGPTARKSRHNELKALFQSGAGEPGLLWWLREDGRVLGRLLLLWEGDGLAAGELVLPWQGSWRGVLKRLLEGVAMGMRRRGAAFLRLGEEALAEEAGGRVSRITLGRELLALGFLPEPPRVVARLERTRTAPPGLVPPLPAGAEPDGADGGVWRLAAAPLLDELERGLAALAAHGARELRLEWPGGPLDLAALLPPDWVLRELRAPLAWRLSLGGKGETTNGHE